MIDFHRLTKDLLLLNKKHKISDWQLFERATYFVVKLQDPKAVRIINGAPDIRLSDGIGLETKTTSSKGRKINFNSSAPNKNYYYIIARLVSGVIKDLAIVAGENYYTPEIDEMLSVYRGLNKTKNSRVFYRTRIMWNLQSPFDLWGSGFFVVNNKGEKHDILFGDVSSGVNSGNLFSKT